MVVIDWSTFSWFAIGLLLAGGILSSALPYSLDTFILRRITPRLYAIITSCSPAIAAVFGVLILHESLGLLQVLRLRRERITREPCMVTEVWLPEHLAETLTEPALAGAPLEGPDEHWLDLRGPTACEIHTPADRDAFETEFRTVVAESPGSQLVGSAPVLIEPCEVVAVAEGAEGFLAAPRY